ncbi:MAG: hypothetical protein ACR2LC_02025 [Pyrinomonadaceae bacterium]
MPRFNHISRAMIAATMIVSITFAAIASTKISAQSRRGTAASSTPTPEAAGSPSPSPSPAATPLSQKKIAAASPETKPVIDAKAEQILRRAIEALGGNSYMNVRSEIGRGLFTPFRDGVSGLPSSFVDYIVFPDRERTEFRSSDGRVIQTNVGAKGWIFDGAKRSIKDMTPEQAEDFRFAMRTNIDSLLRGLWRKEGGATLAYIGRREAGLARRNEVVRLTYADGLAVEFEFGARDGLPAKVIYTRKDSEGKEATEEDRFAQFVATNGILAPFIIDHYRAGAQTSRINYKSLDFNAIIGDELFNKPASLKDLKVK